MSIRILGSLLALFLSTYIILLAKRLERSRFDRRQRTPFPTDEALLRESEDWRKIDVLDSPNIRDATSKRYLVTGGSGQLGSICALLLWQRGERQIYILDIADPPPNLRDLDGIHFIRTDIASFDAVKKAFGIARPDVVFHLCAAIRYWERASYTFSHSKRVNVDGTKHVLQCLQEMPDTSDKVLVYSSTASVCTPPPLLMRLGLNHKGFSATYKISDRFPIPDALRARFAYAATKALADQEVRQANGVGGIRTGVLRPGMGVTSPNDLLGGDWMKRSVNVTFIGKYAQSTINCLDLSAALFMYEHALRSKPEEVAGDAFLITGDRDIWTWDETRSVVQLFAHRDMRYVSVPSLLLYVIGHLVELFCFLRYYALLPFYAIALGTVPSPHPKWMEKTRLHQLQPASWNTPAMDVEIDDTRVREVLGYKNKFSNAQTLRWIVDTVEATEAASTSKQPAQYASSIKATTASTLPSPQFRMKEA